MYNKRPYSTERLRLRCCMREVRASHFALCVHMPFRLRLRAAAARAAQMSQNQNPIWL
jgi:hypothetical protein